jgi:hypothetical protein
MDFNSTFFKIIQLKSLISSQVMFLVDEKSGFKALK